MTRPTFTEARIALHRHVSLWETPESVRNIHHISDRPSSTEAPLIWLRKFAMGFLVAFMVVGGMPLTVMAVWSWASASRQPALVSDQAASRLAPTGFDQAQGGGR